VRLTGDLNILMTKKHVKSMLPLKVNVKIENGIATVSPFALPKATAQTAAAKTEKKPAEPKSAAKAEAKKEAKPAAAKK